MDFALGMKENSRHEIDILSLPDKNWKWRMRGAALSFVKQIKNIEKYNLIFVTDMINLAEFIALLPVRSTPVVLYFHENQLTYPVQQNNKKEGKRDLQFGYINMMSALSATKVFFNSKFQFNEFILKLEQIIKIAPDFESEWIKDEIIDKSKVLYPGCRFAAPDNKQENKIYNPEPGNKKAPLIIWNHRWEWDKNPDDFFEALQILKKKKVPFTLALLGEQYGGMPEVFESAKKEFSDEIIAFGYLESKEEYISLLQKGSIVISTSIQENFGISVVEAVRMGCVPLLPDRLSYPEIMPEKYLNEIIYSNKADFHGKLENMLLNYQDYGDLKEKLSLYMGKYSWHAMINEYDTEFENVLRGYHE